MNALRERRSGWAFWFEMKHTNVRRISWLARTWQKIVNGFGGFLMLVGFGALGIQAFLYLLNEEWIEIPLLYITSFGPSEFTSWLDNPASWIALHKIVYGILNYVSLPLTLILVGMVMVAYEAEP